MELTLFGANGRVGRLVVARALRDGHRVRAFVHSHDPFAPHERLAVVHGDVTDAAVVGEAVAGAGAVVSTLGAFRRGTGQVLGPGLRTITRAMDQHGVRRLVVLTGAGVVRAADRPDLRTRVNRGVLRLMDRSAVADVDDAVAVLEASDLDWSILCAPTITADGEDGHRLTAGMPSLLAKVAGPAVAAALVELAGRAGSPADAVAGIEQG